MKQMHNLVMTKKGGQNEAWGFRIIGGKDEGQTFKVSKIMHQIKSLPKINTSR